MSTRAAGRLLTSCHKILVDKVIRPVTVPSLNIATKTNVWLDNSTRRLVLETETRDTRDVTREEFPWVWLRDNCQSEICYEPISHCRIINLTEWDQSIKPKDVQIKDEQIHITWEDGHVSPFEKSWLLSRSFKAKSRNHYREGIGCQQQLWGGELMETGFPTADYHQIMKDDRALLDWLELLDKMGFVLVRNVPVEEGPVPALQVRAGFEKMTHYGPGYTVVVRPDPANISHTYHRIFFHTDLTYYDYMPGTVFLHCIVQHEGKGGETMLCDGFHCAQLLKESHPEWYHLLSTTCTSWRDVGQDYIQFDKITQKPFLIHDHFGKLQRVNWSHFARDSHLDCDLENVEELYKAMRAFDDIMNDQKNHIRLKMQPGDMVTVKNMRILHGRSELEGGVSGRHLQCGYMDWDEIRSTIRVTRKKLGITS